MPEERTLLSEFLDQLPPDQKLLAHVAMEVDAASSRVAGLYGREAALKELINQVDRELGKTAAVVGDHTGSIRNLVGLVGDLMERVQVLEDEVTRDPVQEVLAEARAAAQRAAEEQPKSGKRTKWTMDKKLGILARLQVARGQKLGERVCVVCGAPRAASAHFTCEKEQCRLAFKAARNEEVRHGWVGDKLAAWVRENPGVAGVPILVTPGSGVAAR